MLIKVKKLHPDAILPEFRTEGSVGADVRSVEDISLPANQAKAVSLGFAVAIPPGYELQVRPRSGLAANHKISIVNTPGTIDSDYRGEVKVILINHGLRPYHIRKGERIAQLVFSRIPAVTYTEVLELDETDRGTGGFGSTGRK